MTGVQTCALPILPDALRTLATLARRTERSILFTFAPRTRALAAMHEQTRENAASDN